MLASRRAFAGRALVISSLLAVTGAAATARAEDRVAFHAAYFREVNTRVIQPMVEATKDLPYGYDVGGHFAVDAITSASIAQGTSEDAVFTEKRYEGGLQFGRLFGPTHVGVYGRYSHEPDYFSYTGGVAVSRLIWGNSGTLSGSFAYTHDDIEPKGVADPKSLNVFFGSVAYTQAITPVTVAQASYDVFFQRGYLANPYIQQTGLGREEVPDRRVRHALALRVAQYVPEIGLGAQLFYRLYFNQEKLTRIGPWGMIAHTFEGRVSKRLGSDVELRFSFRYQLQGKARFWCDARANPACYGDMPQYHSFDPKFGSLRTALGELKLFWDLRVLGSSTPLLGLLAAGTFDVSYGYFFQNTYYGALFNSRNEPPILGSLRFPRSYGGAHLVQTGYSLPF